LVDVDEHVTPPGPTRSAAQPDVDYVANCLMIINIIRTVWNTLSPIIHPATGGSAVAENVNQKRAQQVDSSANAFFSKIAGEDMEVDASELQQILNHALKKDENFKFDGFSLDSCRSMVSLLDDDKTGKLGFDEFATLWRNVREWSAIFKKHDVDNSGNISASELRAALQEMGINVNRHTLQFLVLRYGQVDAKKKGVNEKALTFDDFIHGVLKLKFCIDTWNNKSMETSNFPRNRVSPYLGIKSSSPASATFTLEEFIERVMYC